MMLDDGDYIVIGKLIPGGEAAGKGYSKMLCVVYVCDDRNIHTRAHKYTHVHRATESEEEGGRESYGRRHVHTHVDSTHARVNRYGCVCQVI